MSVNHRPCVLITAAFATLLFSTTVHSSGEDHYSVGFELQIYPTGVIPGVRFERGFNGRHAVHLRLGYQEIRHQDFGEHDDERGNGQGFSAGYTWYRDNGFEGLLFGARTDIWFNTLDWKDAIDTPVERSGSTDVVVLQPTVEVGYRYPLVDNLFFTPSFAAGFEINVDTDGEEVGEGFIYLVGATLGYRF